MTKNEFKTKLKEILKKAGEMADIPLGWMVVSNDPDCDADFGIDLEGNLILGQKKTWLPVSKLKSIRYRAILEEYEQTAFDSYISFCFEDDLKVLTAMAWSHWPGDWFELYYQNVYYSNTAITNDIIYSKEFNWNSLASGEIKTFYEKEIKKQLTNASK